MCLHQPKSCTVLLDIHLLDMLRVSRGFVWHEFVLHICVAHGYGAYRCVSHGLLPSRFIAYTVSVLQFHVEECDENKDDVKLKRVD